MNHRDHKPELKPGQRIKLNVGDRVRIYGHLGQFKATVLAVDQTVNSRYGAVSGMVLVENEDGHHWYQHPRQCVRLRKKEKPAEERNRPGGYVTVHGGDKFPDATIDFAWTEKPLGRYRMVELREGEVIAPLHRLHRHFRKATYQVLGATPEGADQAFEMLCKNLGLKEKP